ncbi:DNA helicase [Vibrio phage pVco-7]
MLNDQQEIVLKRLSIFLARPSAKDIIIDAPAGCGKGYLLNHIHNNEAAITEKVRLLDDRFTGVFVYTATTNEALGVLPTSASTIYSYAGLRPKYPTGFNTRGRPVKDAPIIFVDEASYIGKEAHDAIRYQLPNAKIVWVMDEFQLADVKEGKAYVAQLGFEKLTMNKVMRSTGRIQEISHVLREAVRAEQEVDLRQFDDGNQIVLLSPSDFDKKIIEEYKKSRMDCRYLAFNREIVKQYNNAIHKHVFGHPDFPHAHASAIINKYNENVGLRCGTHVGIRKVTTKQVLLDKGHVITETHLETNKDTLILCDDKVPKGIYNPNRFLYSDIALPYGCTVHKSQGQSIPNIFLDLPNIESCFSAEMRRRLRYVGWSRASNKIYMKDY